MIERPTKVRVHDDAQLGSANQERRDQAPYLRRQSEESILGEVEPAEGQDAKYVGRERRDEDCRRQCPCHWRRLPIGVHDFGHFGFARCGMTEWWVVCCVVMMVIVCGSLLEFHRKEAPKVEVESF